MRADKKRSKNENKNTVFLTNKTMADDLDKEIKNDNDDDPTEKVAELMENHDLDKEEAEHVQEIMEEYGLDEDDAVELSEEL